MNILVQNNSSLANKVVRFIKWKLYKLGRKFSHLTSAEVYLKEEGSSLKTYYVTIKLSTRTSSVILKRKSNDLVLLLRTSTKGAHRYLNESKPMAKNMSYMSLAL